MGESRRFATDAPYDDDMADILHGAGVASLPWAGVPMRWCSAGVPIRSLLRIPMPLSIPQRPVGAKMAQLTLPLAGRRRRRRLRSWARLRTREPSEQQPRSRTPPTGSLCPKLPLRKAPYFSMPLFFVFKQARFGSRGLRTSPTLSAIFSLRPTK